MTFNITKENENSNFNKFFSNDKLKPIYASLLERGHHTFDKSSPILTSSLVQEEVYAYLSSLDIQIGTLLKVDSSTYEDLSQNAKHFDSASRYGLVLIGFTPTHTLLASWHESLGIDNNKTISLHKIFTKTLDSLLSLQASDKLEGFISPKLLILNAPDILSATLIRTSNMFRKFCRAVDSSVKTPRTVYDYCFFIPPNQDFSNNNQEEFSLEELPAFITSSPKKRKKKDDNR